MIVGWYTIQLPAGVVAAGLAPCRSKRRELWRCGDKSVDWLEGDWRLVL
jgi:hypothetical protein